MHRCSFLTQGHARAAQSALSRRHQPGRSESDHPKDPTQQAASSIIEQVAQVTLFRVVIPWMIGKAFERVGDEEFMQLVAAKLNEKKDIPGPVLKELDPVLQKLLDQHVRRPEVRRGSSRRSSAVWPACSSRSCPKFQELIHELVQGRRVRRAGRQGHSVRAKCCSRACSARSGRGCRTAWRRRSATTTSGRRRGPG